MRNNCKAACRKTKKSQSKMFHAREVKYKIFDTSVTLSLPTNSNYILLKKYRWTGRKYECGLNFKAMFVYFNHGIQISFLTRFLSSEKIAFYPLIKLIKFRT